MHIDIFEANGFTFVDDDKHGSLRLSAIPMSKNTAFGPEDVAELAVQLQEGGLKPVAVGKQQAPQKIIRQNIPRPSRYHLSLVRLWLHSVSENSQCTNRLMFQMHSFYT